MQINRLNVKRITRYGYRTAMVKKVLTISRNGEDGIELEKWLNSISGEMPENHVCFDIEEKGGNHLYIMCTDNSIYIGTTIIVGSW